LAVRAVLVSTLTGTIGAQEVLHWTPAESQYLAEYGAVLSQLQAMSLPEFLSEFQSGKQFLTAANASFLRGDANRDLKLDLADPICVLLHLFLGVGPCTESDCADAFDTNDSGTLDIADPMRVLNFLFADGPPPSAPFPLPGNDASDDDLGCGAPDKLGYEPTVAEYLPQIFAAYPPTVRQEDAYRENGLVIYGNVRYESMLRGFFEIYRRDLPVYITVDSILDALHLSFDRLLIRIEEGVLFDELDGLLREMEPGLATVQAEAAAAGVNLDRELDDAATWLCVARSLLAGEKVACQRGMDAATTGILTLVQAGAIAPAPLFGRDPANENTKVDFSQFIARHHYTRSERLGRYFQAMTWVRRIGLRFAERPREARVAYVLTRLLDTGSASERLAKLNEAISALAGGADALDPAGLKSFLSDHGFSLGDLADSRGFLRFAATANSLGLGREQINSQVLQGCPEAPEELVPYPPLFNVLRQPFVVDSYVFQNVVYDRVPALAGTARRILPSPLDAWFVLGNRDAVPLLAEDLQAWSYHPNLASLQWLVGSYPQDFWEDNFYNAWLAALQTLHADTTSTRYPPVMRTDAWTRRILQAQLASWSHMRHDFVLLTKPSYPPQGCFYPDGWVDPYPEFYETLAGFAARARQSLAPLGPAGRQPGESGREGHFDNIDKYLSNLETVGRELAGIARAELEGNELTEQQSQFIASWLFQRGPCNNQGPIGPLEPIFFDGWYPQIIFEADGNDAEPFDPVVADIHTVPPGSNTPTGQVLHVGVGYPNLCLISIQNPCGIRAYAGPVLSYHEWAEEGIYRWTDEGWKEHLEAGVDAPRPSWTRALVR
jgi:hypothetical protein